MYLECRVEHNISKVYFQHCLSSARNAGGSGIAINLCYVHTYVHDAGVYCKNSTPCVFHNSNENEE